MVPDWLMPACRETTVSNKCGDRSRTCIRQQRTMAGPRQRQEKLQHDHDEMFGYSELGDEDAHGEEDKGTAMQESLGVETKDSSQVQEEKGDEDTQGEEDKATAMQVSLDVKTEESSQV